MEFTYKAHLPTLDMDVPVRELTTKDYITLVKCIANDDTTVIESVFEELIKSQLPKNIYNKITRLDKFFILLTIRAVSVGPTVSLTFTDEPTGKPYTSHVQLFEVLQHIADVEYVFSKEIEVVPGEVTVTITPPNGLQASVEEEVLLDCIRTIKINKTRHDMSSFSREQKKNIVDNLPGKIIHELQLYINDSTNTFGDVMIFKKLNPHTPQPVPEEYAVNFYDNSMIGFIMTCFSESLKYIYDIIYVLSKHCTFSSDLIMGSTFAELRMYVDLYEEDLKEQQKAMDEENKSGSSSPPPIGNPIVPEL